MRTKVISYGLHDLTLALFRADDDGDRDLIELVLDESEKELRSDYLRLYNDLTAGKIDFFLFGDKTKHFFSRSTRPGVAVQASVIWDRAGELVPLSHRDIVTFSDMVRPGDGLCKDGVVVSYGVSSDL